VVAERLTEELEKARRSNDIIATPLEHRRNRRAAAAQRWPD
jgi:L-seryl-tRNA(Ser) seleniumtransferase